MPAIASIRDLLLHEMKDLYDAEHQILEALPKVIKSVHHSELSEAFQLHSKQTEGHIKRLEQAFEMLDEKAERQTCDGMKGLLKEGNKALSEDMEDNVMDAAIIAAAQKVEHYEISGYGTVCTLARLIEHDDVAELLEETLDEEKDTDAMLTDIAEQSVNLDAPLSDTEEEAE